MGHNNDTTEDSVNGETTMINQVDRDRAREKEREKERAREGEEQRRGCEGEV